jgi:hypothetical protein
MPSGPLFLFLPHPAVKKGQDAENDQNHEDEANLLGHEAAPSLDLYVFIYIYIYIYIYIHIYIYIYVCNVCVCAHVYV